MSDIPSNSRGVSTHWLEEWVGHTVQNKQEKISIFRFFYEVFRMKVWNFTL